MNKQKLYSFLKEVFFILLFVTVVSNILSLYNARTLNDNPLRLKTCNLVDNSTFTVPENKPVMIHFWGSWCPVCKAEADNIQRLSPYYNILTIAVNSGDDTAIQNYLRDRGFDYKVFNDQQGVLAKEFGVQAFPTTFIYDRNKKLVFKEVGYTSTIGLWLRLLWASWA